MSDPIYCQIQIKGHLSAQWGYWFDALSIENHPDGHATLQGQLADQTVLYSLLDRLRDLGISLVSLTCTESGAKDVEQTPTTRQNRE